MFAMCLVLLTVVLFVVSTIAATIDFVNPGPAGPNSEYNLNPSYAYGSQIEIQWTPSNETISIILNQQTNNDIFEYVFQNRAGLSAFSWVVQTEKDLSVSRIFFFQLFVKGETGAAATSHYFNITDDAASSASSSAPTALTSTSATSSTATSSDSSAVSTTNTAASTATSATSTPSPNVEGLSLGAKIGIGVGVPIAVIAGLVAGWLFFGRRNRRNQQTQSGYSQYEQPHYGSPHAAQGYYGQSYGGASPVPQHLGNMQPSEMSTSTYEVKEMDSHSARSPVELPQTRS